jgi:single-strand DNA-binding protein
MGNLGGDVEIKALPDGTSVGNFSIACGEKWKDKATGEIKEKTEWVRVVVFGRRAEVISEHFKKGSQIYVSGKLRTREWEKDGAKHYMTEVVADNFQFCGQRSDTGSVKVSQQAAAYQPQPDNFEDFDLDIPF